MAKREALRELQSRLAERMQAARTQTRPVSWLAVECRGQGLLFPLIVAIGLLGFGQGWALPTLVRSVIDRAPAQASGMISGVANSALQISASLGVALFGGVFFGIAGTAPHPELMAHALVVTMLCIGASLGVAALLSVFGWVHPPRVAAGPVPE